MPTSQSKIQELELLYKISSILNQTLDFESVAHPILEVVESTMGVEHATLTLYNRHTGEISIEIAEGLSSRQARKGRYKVGEGITGRVVETGKPIIIPSVAKDPDFLDRTGRGKTEDKAFLCVPVIMEHQVIGAFSADVQNPVEEELPEKLRLLEIIAQMLAAAVKLRREAREENELLKAENERLTLELKDRFHPDNIIGRSSEMQRVYAQIDQVSRSPLPALIVGEVGTGKGLVAEAIHYRSDRNMGPFVRVHCASMPESVLDRELFGSERGALVGVISETPGRVEQAEGGTLFLDEVGELSPNLQVKLLRLLQHGEVERIGARISKKVNVRVIAATTKNLQQMVEEGTFREDLYYQLHIFPIYVPPLRNRNCPHHHQHAHELPVARKRARTRKRHRARGTRCRRRRHLSAPFPDHAPDRRNQRHSRERKPQTHGGSLREGHHLRRPQEQPWENRRCRPQSFHNSAHSYIQNKPARYRPRWFR